MSIADGFHAVGKALDKVYGESVGVFVRCGRCGQTSALVDCSSCGSTGNPNNPGEILWFHKELCPGQEPFDVCKAGQHGRYHGSCGCYGKEHRKWCPHCNYCAICFRHDSYRPREQDEKVVLGMRMTARHLREQAEWFDCVASALVRGMTPLDFSEMWKGHLWSDKHKEDKVCER